MRERKKSKGGRGQGRIKEYNSKADRALWEEEGDQQAEEMG